MSQEFIPAALLYSSRKHVLSNKKLKKSHCWLPALMKFFAGWRELTRVQWHCRKSESFTGSLIGAYCKSITKIQMSCWWSFIHFSDYKCNILWTICYAKQIHVFSSTLKSSESIRHSTRHFSSVTLCVTPISKTKKQTKQQAQEHLFYFEKILCIFSDEINFSNKGVRKLKDMRICF